MQSDTDIVAGLYDGIVDGSALERALTRVAERFHCDCAALTSFDATAPRNDLLAITGPAWSADTRRQYQADWATLDPAPRAFAALPQGRAAVTSRLFAADFLRNCRFFHEFYRANGHEESLGGNLSSRDGHAGLICLQRGKDRRPFTDADIAAFETFTPHLARALQLRRTFTALATTLASLMQVIDRLAVGVIVLSHEGAEIHVNRAAREIAARGDGLLLDRKGGLCCTDREAARGFAQACADVRLGGAGGIIRVPRRTGPAYGALVAPLPAGARHSGIEPEQPNLLILIHDPAARVPTAPETVASIFGLPMATARLVSALAEGDDTKSYAERHRITMDAVKFHLKVAFAKMGLRSQARLLQAVARALAELGERQPPGR